MIEVHESPGVLNALLDDPMRLQTLRVVHHKLFGSYPHISRAVHTKGDWLARSDESARTVIGRGRNEADAVLALIYGRIRGSWGHEYKRELAR